MARQTYAVQPTSELAAVAHKRDWRVRYPQ